MSRNIEIIAQNDTFEEWFNKTNLLIEAIQDTLTIGDGEVNAGDVYLNGNISVNSIFGNEITVEDINLDTFVINNASIIKSDLSHPLKLQTSIASDSLPAAGMKIGWVIENTLAWEVGPAINPSSFEIKSPIGAFSLQLNTDDTLTSATLTGTQIKISNDILPNQITANTTGSAATCNAWSSQRTVTFATGDVTGEFAIDGSTNVNNVVLTVNDNSHKHTVANITDLQEALDGKLPNSSIVGSVQNLKVNGYGILAKTEDALISMVEIAAGSGISVDNGKGVGGNPTINHQPGQSTLASIDNSSNPAGFIKNITVDSFGHISAMESGNVPLGRSFDSGEKAITAGAQSLSHGLSATPSLIKVYLKCKTVDNNFAVGELIPFEFITTNFMGVSATNSKINYGIGTSPSINVIDPKSGSQVTLTNSRWKLLIKAWV